MANQEKPKGHDQKHDDTPSQHDGGVGNLQKEPQSAEEAKKRAAEAAEKKKK